MTDPNTTTCCRNWCITQCRRRRVAAVVKRLENWLRKTAFGPTWWYTALVTNFSRPFEGILISRCFQNSAAAGLESVPLRLPESLRDIEPPQHVGGNLVIVEAIRLVRAPRFELSAARCVQRRRGNFCVVSRPRRLQKVSHAGGASSDRSTISSKQSRTIFAQTRATQASATSRESGMCLERRENRNSPQGRKHFGPRLTTCIA